MTGVSQPFCSVDLLTIEASNGVERFTEALDGITGPDGQMVCEIAGTCALRLLADGNVEAESCERHPSLTILVDRSIADLLQERFIGK